MTTLREVAKLAGVDPSTVSRVLRNDPVQVVRPETRERIVRAAAEVGYRPNSLARALRLQRTRTLALLVHDFDNIGFSEVTRGVQAAANEAGYLLLLGEVRPEDNSEDAYAGLLLEGRVDGLLVAFARLDDELVRDLDSRRLPVVLVSRRADGVGTSVVADDVLGSTLAVEHLVDLGHRRIGFVAGAPNTDTGARRLEGYLAGLEGGGIAVDPDWIARGDFTEAGGFAAAQTLLRLGADRRPTALYAANLLSGLGAVAGLRDAGVDIPHDVSIVVMDEHFIARHTNPPLTTVQLPLFEIGVEAVRLLIDAIEGKNVSSVVLDQPPRIIVRGSSAALGSDLPV